MESKLNSQSIRQKVIEYLKQQGNLGPQGLGGDQQDLIADGVVDSFGLLSLITHLEEQFSIRIDASQIDPATFNTIERITKVVAASK